MRQRRRAGVQKLVFWVFLIIGVGIGSLMAINHIFLGVALFIVLTAVGWILSSAIQVADQWEKAIVLRLGKFKALAGPGVFFMIPFIDSVPAWIDQRIITTQFTAEQTLTKDTVPVNVDAVVFWMVWDAEKAALEVADFASSVSWAAQTALRDLIGSTMLEDLLSSREDIDHQLKKLMDTRTEPWGITIQNVQIRDISIPRSLEDAMSRAAQAERERNARAILGQAEQQVAESFVAAAEMYARHPAALQLRALNILYEGLKEKASMIVVPSSLADAANLGSLLGTVAAEKLIEHNLQDGQSATEGMMTR
ncbi:slipin family protein [Alicyclobacillus mengziensis]|uniref:Slipin family protein n=1 Tax=Alicyclobacillus mengziensis TaxID=2931921 RepID=A0A9X7VWE0_9BACL|nr:slipin family protein [Alicyclobacillus mengziensis]QSO45825.1 slipin family protein [Alicyclobacillus mengziensis]